MGDSLTVRQGVTFIIGWLIFVGGIVAVVFLSGCATAIAPWEREIDHLGNPWPPACRQDLIAAVKPDRVQVIPMPRAALYNAVGREADGLTWTLGVKGDEVIWIIDDLRGWKKDAVIRHEYCHLAEYGGVAWHT